MILVGECRSGANLEGPPAFAIGEGFVGHVWAEGTEVVYTDIAEEASHIIEKAGERRYNSIIGVPIKVTNEIVGIVVISSQQKNEISKMDADNVKRYQNLILLALLIELSRKLKGGDKYDVLVKALKQDS